MLFIPGQGLLAIAAGLAVLAKEYDWARSLQKRIEDRIRLEKAKRSRKKPPASPR